jgi:signal transduction histidine kinase
VVLHLLYNTFFTLNEIKNQELDGYEPIAAGSSRQKGSEITMKVKDTGPMIAREVLDKIFPPFFTTRPVGRGTGLGLSLSYDIVKAHGGELRVETKQGQGSEFIIILPLTQKQTI